MYFLTFFVSATDCDERKLKGVIYFQAIEEVYYDHLRTATSVSHLSIARSQRSIRELDQHQTD